MRDVGQMGVGTKQCFSRCICFTVMYKVVGTREGRGERELDRLRIAMLENLG